MKRKGGPTNGVGGSGVTAASGKTGQNPSAPGARVVKGKTAGRSIGNLKGLSKGNVAAKGIGRGTNV